MNLRPFWTLFACDVRTDGGQAGPGRPALALSMPALGSRPPLQYLERYVLGLGGRPELHYAPHVYPGAFQLLVSLRWYDQVV